MEIPFALGIIEIILVQYLFSFDDRIIFPIRVDENLFYYGMKIYRRIFMEGVLECL